MLGDVQREDVHLGHVYRHRDQRQAQVQAAAAPAADALPDVLVQVGDEAVFLQHRHEGRGRHHLAVGLDPAGQRLRAHDAARGGPHLGLQPEGDLVVLQGVLEVGEDAVVLRRLVVHRGVEGAYAVLEVLLGVLAGQRGLVEQVQYRGVAV